MNIILEGPDATGKSTLADRIKKSLGWGVVSSEGPEKSPGEMVQRVSRYLSQYPSHTIFDRHPCVSDPIYGKYRADGSPLPAAMVSSLYSMRPLFIYCRPHNGHAYPHILKPHDTPDHQAMIRQRADEIAKDYDAWALEHAHIFYRIGDPVHPLMSFILGYIDDTH